MIESRLSIHEHLQATYNLLFRVLVGAEQINGLHVAKVDIMAEQKYEQ